MDLWFATSEDTLRKFDWPNIPYDDEKTNNKSEGFEEINDDDDIIEGVSIRNDEKESEKELKEMLREIVQETMMFEEPTELSDEQKEFQKLTKVNKKKIFFHY